MGDHLDALCVQARSSSWSLIEPEHHDHQPHDDLRVGVLPGGAQALVAKAFGIFRMHRFDFRGSECTVAGGPYVDLMVIPRERKPNSYECGRLADDYQ
jgi:hypothetical protein